MDFTNDQRAWADEGVAYVAPGFLRTAKQIKRFLDILKDERVPLELAVFAVQEWIKADAQLWVQATLHGVYAQQHAAQEQK